VGIDENDFFRQVTLRMSSSLKIETAMKRCMAYLKQHMAIDGMLFGLYDPELNVGRILAGIWPPEIRAPGKTIYVPVEFWTRMKAEWDRGPDTRVYNDIDAEPDEMRQIFRLIWPPEWSHITMDLELDDQRLGLFHLFARGKHRFTDQQARLLSLLHDPLALALSNMLRHQEISRLKDILADDNQYLRQQMMEMTGDTIVGANFGLREAMRMLRQVAPLNVPVLLMGETGVGKEVIANTIHQLSGRDAHPFIKVNCGAIPENLIDSELFGHEKGAFTGAISKKRGRFERAHTGTIFLDEIGELPPPAQVRLLRVLQHHEIERVGGTGMIPVDARILAATHQDLEAMTRRGGFREDLWFRLNVFPITIPPLRHRAGDIPALVYYFIDRKSRDLKLRDLPHLAPGTIEGLQSYHWPGNVRELENLVERALILHQMKDGDQPLKLDLIRQSASAGKTAATAAEDQRFCSLDEAISAHIRRAMDRCGGRVEGPGGAAQQLGLHPSTLRGRMRKLGIPHGRLARQGH
jgi:transcriptional regulator with GAF, ATPase, and Fis domain